MSLMETNREKTAREIQDDIFRKMSASKKVKLASELTHVCLGLNNLNKENENNRLIKRDG